MNTPFNSEASGQGRHGLGADITVRQLLPLTVWLCSETTDANITDDHGKDQRGKTGQVCYRHRQAVGRELARHLITACTLEGDLVAEVYTSSEVTLAAAAELGRRAVACVPHFPLAQHIGSRLRETLSEGKLAGLAMRPCRPDQMARGLADHLEIAVRAGWRDPVRVTVRAVVEHVPRIERPFEASISDPSLGDHVRPPIRDDVP